MGDRLPGTSGAAIATQFLGELPAGFVSESTLRRIPAIAFRNAIRVRDVGKQSPGRPPSVDRAVGSGGQFGADHASTYYLGTEIVHLCEAHRRSEAWGPVGQPWIRGDSCTPVRSHRCRRKSSRPPARMSAAPARGAARETNRSGRTCEN
jgi:hypothetical protein